MAKYRVTLRLKGPSWMDNTKVATVRSEIPCTAESAGEVARRDASLQFNIPEKDITVVDVTEEF